MALKTVGGITFYKEIAEKVVNSWKGELHNFFKTPKVQKLIEDNNFEEIFKIDEEYVGYPVICVLLLSGVDFLSHLDTIPDGFFQARDLDEGGVLQRVDLHEGITRIGDSAFEGCGNLEYIILPRTLKEIDFKAFNHTGLSMNDGVKRVFYTGRRIDFTSGIGIVEPIFSKDKIEVNIYCNDGSVWYY